MKNRLWKISFATILMTILVCLCAWAAADGEQTGPTLTLAPYNEEQVHQNNDGSVSIPFHQYTQFRVTAPGSMGVDIYSPFSLSEPLNDDNYVTDTWPGDSWEDFTWTPNLLPDGFTGTSFDQYVVAVAHYGENAPDRTVIIPIHITVDKTIANNITFTVPNIYTYSQSAQIPLIAQDGIFYVDVANQDEVDFYGAYITANGQATTDWKQWIADSHWISKDKGATTRVPLTVPRCVPRETVYEVHVYAIKFGAPQAEASVVTPIFVTPAMTEDENGELVVNDCPVILSMEDTYTTGEPMNVFAYYTNPDQLKGWMEIRIHREGIVGEIIYTGAGKFDDYWDMGIRCWDPGTYTADAEIWCWDEEAEENRPVRFYEGIGTIQINPTKQEEVTAPTFTHFSTLTAGNDLELHVSAPEDTVKGTKAAEGFSVAILRTDWGWTWVDGAEIEADENGAATIFFDGDEYYFEAGGQYLLVINACRIGNDTYANEEFRFIMTSPEATEENLTLTVNGKGTAQQTVLSNEDIHVQVGFQDRPTVVRIMNGDGFDYWYGEEEDFSDVWQFGDGDLLMYAEASWDTIDFDTLNNNRWTVTGEDGKTRNFDWNTDVTWTGRSNLIQLKIDSPYGEMAEPSFTIDNELTDGKIPWGNDLIINIADEGPMCLHGEGPAEVLDGGWFFFNIEKKVVYTDGTYSWDPINKVNIELHSGVNHIPTYFLEDGCTYRIEIGADAIGYSGRSDGKGFTIGKKTGNEPTSYFIVDGEPVSGMQTISMQTFETLSLMAYDSQAEWYSVEISENGDTDWHESLNNCESGMLIDYWRPYRTGSFTLTTYAYGNNYSEYGNPIGSITVTVDADHGPLAENGLNARLDARSVEVDEDLNLYIAGINAAEEYSYWIHSVRDEGRRLAGESRPSNEMRPVEESMGQPAGTLQMRLDTRGLQPDAYVVEVDVMATGYIPAHTTLYYVKFGGDNNYPGILNQGYRYAYSAATTATEGDIHMFAYCDGADGVRLLSQKIVNGKPQQMEEFGRQDIPVISEDFCRGDAGTYQIYMSRHMEGTGWSAPVLLFTATVTAEHSFAADPAITINGVSSGTTGTANFVPVDEDNPSKITVSIARDQNAKGYHVRVQKYGEGWTIYDDFIDLNRENWPNNITVTDNSIEIEIENEYGILPGEVYEVECQAHAPNYESREGRRFFLLQGETTEGITLEVTHPGRDKFWVTEEAQVTVSAPGATTIMIRLNNNEPRCYTGSTATDTFRLQDEENIFQAYATTTPTVTGEIDWSMQATPVLVLADSEGPTETPTLSFTNGTNQVERGEWLAITIGDDGDAKQMDIRIRDDDGHEMGFYQMWEPGDYLIPTAGMGIGETYRLEMSCLQDRHLWADAASLEFSVIAPETDTAFLRAAKTTIYAGEPLIVTAYAPGATSIGFGRADSEENIGTDGLWLTWQGDQITGEWQCFDQPGEYILYAMAEDENGDWTVIDETVSMHVQPRTRLAEAEITVPDMIDVTEDNDIYIDAVEGGETYRIQIHATDDGNEENWMRWTRTVRDIDTDRNHLAITIPANTLEANKSYWIDCYVDPENHDYSHNGSDSSKNIMTRRGETTDSDIAISLYAPPKGQTWEYDEETGRYRILANISFDVTVTATNSTHIPTAVAVYLGGQSRYCLFNNDNGSAMEERFELYGYEEWPQAIIARAYYGELAEEPNWDSIQWGAPSNLIPVTFYTGETGAFSFDVNCPIDETSGYATVTRGQDIMITYQAAENATNYWIDVERYNEDENQWGFAYHGADLHQEEAAKTGVAGYGILETYEFEAGARYRFYAGAGAPGYTRRDGYRGNDTAPLELRITESTTDAAIWSINGTTEDTENNETYAWTWDELSFGVYVPGANSVELKVLNSDGNVINQTPGTRCYARIGNWFMDCEGEIGLEAIVQTENGEDTLTYPKTIKIKSKGMLPAPTILLNSYTVEAGKDITFFFADNPELLDGQGNRKPEYEDAWYNVYLWDQYGGCILQEYHDVTDNNQYFSTEKLEPDQVYRVSVDIQQHQYTGVAADAYVMVVPEKANVGGQGFTLKVNDSTGEVSIPMNSRYSVTATAPEGATGIEVLNPNGGWYCQAGNTFETDDWSYINPREGAIIIARYTTDSALDEYGTFDWNNVTWTGYSEPVIVNFICKGTVPEFAYTVSPAPTTEQEHTTVTRGEYITVTINDVDEVISNIQSQLQEGETFHRNNLAFHAMIATEDNGWMTEWYRWNGIDEIRIPTARIENAGTYKIMITADYEEGWIGSNAESPVTVTGNNSGAFFLAGKMQLTTSEEFSVSLYVPGATSVAIVEVEGNNENFMWSNGEDTLVQSHSYGNSGTYTLRAKVYSEGQGEWVAVAGLGDVTVTVTAEPNKAIHGTVSIPATIGEGEDLPISWSTNTELDKVDLQIHAVSDYGSWQIWHSWHNGDSDGATVPASMPERYDGANFDQMVPIGSPMFENGTIYRAQIYIQKFGWEADYHEVYFAVISNDDGILKLPDSLTTIEEEAFAGINAKQVEIGETVTTISERAFADIPGLLIADFAGDGQIEINGRAFENTRVLIVCYPNSSALQFARDNHIPYALKSQE